MKKQRARLVWLSCLALAACNERTDIAATAVSLAATATSKPTTAVPTATAAEQTVATPLPVETTELVPGAWHDMVYHEQLQQVVLVNGGPEEGKGPDEPLELWGWDGAQGDSIMGDTWSWEGQQWTQLSSSGPSPRFPGGFVYDAAREAVLLASGHFIDLQRGEFLTFGDSWLWDGVNWQEAFDFLFQDLIISLEFNDEHGAGITLRSLSRVWQAAQASPAFDKADILKRLAAILNITPSEAQALLEQNNS